jgi:hypothetical protein
MNKNLMILAVAAGMAVSSLVVRADGVVALPAATQEVLQTYPGTRVHTDQGRVRIIYGAPMTAGITPEHAAAGWLQEHGAALGCPDPDLRLTWSATLKGERFTVFAFQQFLDDVAVEEAIARILVLNHPVPRVVYAAGTLAPATPQDLAEPLLDGETAIAIVRAQRLYRDLPVWSKAEPGIYQGIGGWIAPVRVWKFVGEQPDLKNRRKLTFFVNATTGQLVHARNEVLHQGEITGQVRARATPGTNPDVPGNAPVLTPLGDIRINVFNGTSDYANADGSITLPHWGNEPVTLRSRLGPASNVGRWAGVADQANNVLVLTQVVTPPGPVTLTFNNTPQGAPGATTTAQVNAFIHTNLIHDFFRSRSGTWSLIDHPLRANVNIDSSCNAFYDGSSINFFTAGTVPFVGTCPNTAYSSIIAHEYGHHIVNQLGIGQGGFGEGYSDCCSALLYDDIVLGRQFLNGQPGRLPMVANVQYPCDLGAIHDCGQLLAAVWWRIRQNMGTFYGSANGLERTRQMFVDWSLITTGGEGEQYLNSAHYGTFIEILTINDDDGNLSNGTPDLPRICPVAPLSSLSCPATVAVNFQFPSGRPEFILPNQPATIDVNVIPMALTPTTNTGRLVYRVNSGTWIQSNMTHLGSHQYRGTIPAQTCGSVVDYYFTVTVPGLGTVPFPELAPSTTFVAPVAQSIQVAFEDDFEIDRGWLDHDEDDDAVTGRWTRGIPQATEAQPGANRTPGGDTCWVTDYRAGAQVSDYDVDGGKTTLISPLIDLSGSNNAVVTFWAWYSNNVGPVNPGTNIFKVDVSADDGASWFSAVTLGPDSVETSGGWREYRFRIMDFIQPTSQFRIRFIASDYTNSIVEAAIDDVRIISLNCGPAPVVGCYANCDGSATAPILNIDDFVCFINRYAAGEPWANCDGSTAEPVLNVDDFTCFLNQFVQGCP